MTAIKVVPILIIMLPFYFIMFATMMATMPRGQASPEDMSRFMTFILRYRNDFLSPLSWWSASAVEIFFMFAYPLVADRKLSGLDAVKLSIKAGKANFGGIAGLVVARMPLLGFAGTASLFRRRVPLPADRFCCASRRLSPRIPGQLQQTFASPPPPPASWA